MAFLSPPSAFFFSTRLPAPSRCTPSRHRTPTVPSARPSRFLHMRISRHNFDPSLYLVTDRKTTPGMTVEQIVAQVTSSSSHPHRVTFVQLRDKHVSREQSLHLGKVLRQITARANVAFVVNDDIQLAALVQADGVHLGQEDESVSAARQVLGNDAIVGVSADSEQEIDIAIADGADYVGVGPVFATSSKPDAGEAIGQHRLRQLVEYTQHRIPVVAIGGIDATNASLCKSAGADGVAVISAIMRTHNPQHAAYHLSSIMNAPNVAPLT